MHYWHDLPPVPLTPRGKDSFHLLNAVVEIPAASKVKYELDKKTGMIRVDRILPSAMHYPLNYGFIPQTYCEDKDPLDVLIFAQVPLLPASLVQVRPLGTLEMLDEGERDDKVVAVCASDPEFVHLTALKQISPHKLKEVRHFFETYKQMEGKRVQLQKTLDEEDTLQLIKKSAMEYKKRFKA